MIFDVVDSPNLTQEGAIEEGSTAVGASCKTCLPHTVKSWISIEHLGHCEEKLSLQGDSLFEGELLGFELNK